MKRNDLVEYLLKGISLLILDLITIIIVFSVWILVNISVFPLAFLAIFTALAMLNLVVVASGIGVQKLGIGVYDSVLLSTFLYYLATMIFTGLTYIWISPKWYLVLFLITSLIYVVTLSALYVAGMNNSHDRMRQENEKERTLDLNLQLMYVNDNLMESKNFVDSSYYDEMVAAYADLVERIKASTPFGRILKPIVQDVENKIIDRLIGINEKVILLRKTDDSQDKQRINESFMEIKSLVINREKLIIQ